MHLNLRIHVTEFLAIWMPSFVKLNEFLKQTFIKKLFACALVSLLDFQYSSMYKAHDFISNGLINEHYFKTGNINVRNNVLCFTCILIVSLTIF